LLLTGCVLSGTGCVLPGEQGSLLLGVCFTGGGVEGSIAGTVLFLFFLGGGGSVAGRVCFLVEVGGRRGFCCLQGVFYLWKSGEGFVAGGVFYPGRFSCCWQGVVHALCVAGQGRIHIIDPDRMHRVWPFAGSLAGASA
jgi:hypothetical protein